MKIVNMRRAIGCIAAGMAFLSIGSLGLLVDLSAVGIAAQAQAPGAV